MSLLRLRLLFAVLALVVAGPLAFLGHRALSSAEAERDLEHRAVADRFIDAMETELNLFLLREEDRPFSHYRQVLVPDTPIPSQVPTLSPLATSLPEPFVVGPFQRDDAGRITSPLGEDEAPTVAELQRMLAAWNPGQTADLPSADEPSSVDQDQKAASGELEKKLRHLEEAKAGRTEPLQPKQKKAPPISSPLEALRQLNQATTVRRQRVSKTTQTQAYNVQTEDLALEGAPSEEMAVDDDLIREVDVRLEPMVGVALDEERMVLYRITDAGGRIVRQGLVLDTVALVRWLARRTAPQGERSLFPFVQIRPVSDAAVDEDPRTSVFRHRFADPFSPAVAIVTVSSPGPWDPARVIRTVLAVLFVALAGGLLALYRMVVVALRYAERRADFVAAVTHELKTPLTAIRMYSEMLRDGVVTDPDKRQRYYETLTAEGERLSRLVDNVLDLGRLERGAGPLATRPGDVRPILEAARDLLRPHADSRGATLEIEIDEGLPAADFDADALTQILVNLVDNALKYSGESGASHVSLRARRSRGSRVCVSVADRGPGVPPSDLRRLFEPFWRGGRELTRETKGTGIGLALVRGLAERMGATVEARNRPDGGLEIRVLLNSPNNS